MTENFDGRSKFETLLCRFFDYDWGYFPHTSLCIEMAFWAKLRFWLGAAFEVLSWNAAAISISVVKYLQGPNRNELRMFTNYSCWR